MTPVRGFLSFLLVVSGLALGAVAVPVLWAQQHLLDTERYTEAVAPLIVEAPIQQRVSEELTAAITDQLNLPEFFVPALRELTDRAVATDRFAGVWEEAVRISHVQLMEGIREEGTGLTAEEGQLRVDLAPLAESLKPRLTEAGVPFLELLPEVEGSVTLEDSREVAEAMQVAGVVDRWAVPLAAVSLALLLAGVLCAVRSLRALGLVGVCVVLVAVAYTGAWEFGWRGDAVAESDPAARLVVEALTRSVPSWLTAIGAGGLVVTLIGVVGSLLLGRRRA